MRAIKVLGLGDASQLAYEEVPLPEPKPGEVRVKIAAAGLNFVEIYERKGLYPKPTPFIPGGELAGTIDALGEGVTGFHTGERVATTNGQGSYAGFAIVPAARLVPVPDSISLDLAAAALLQGMTAHCLALSVYPLKPGDSAVIHAAAGGVGQLLVQIAKMQDATLYATVSTDEKAKIARDAGADHVILYSREDFEQVIRRLTNGSGVNVVYDSVGQATFAKSLNCLKPRGYMVLYGQASGPVEPVDPQILNQKGSLFLTRPSTRDYIRSREELLDRAKDLFQWIASGELQVKIDRRFPLREAAAAQTYMEERRTKGKVLLIPEH